MQRILALGVLLFALAACGRAPDAPARVITFSATRAQVQPPASAYTNLLEQIYLATFGRPADPAGLAYFADRFAAYHAPTTMEGLSQGYLQGTLDPAVSAMVDSFSLSAESSALYAGDNDRFVSAVYRNLFNRKPDSGKEFWVNLLNQGTITRANAAISILSGATGTDAAIVLVKTKAATDFTNALSTPARRDAYSGLDADDLVRQVLLSIKPDSPPDQVAGLLAQAISSLENSDVMGKVTAGYQGWFAAEGDGADNGWVHWSPGVPPAHGTVKFEIWPDMREYASTFATRLANQGNGQPARLFSSYTASTVATHVRWMREYGIDTIAVQRFGTDIATPQSKARVDAVLDHVRREAEANQRKFYVMYDITGWTDFSTKITQDWTGTVEQQLKLLASPAYARHNGKPIVCIWGLGFTDRPGTPAQGRAVVDWFKSKGLYVIGGVPTFWRDGTRDAQAGYADVYRSFHMLQPWMAGRIRTPEDADAFVADVVRNDLDRTREWGIDYLPVIFPGFAWSNLVPGAPRNEIPRLHGEFMWRQAYNLKLAGARGVYVGMFDEFDEGTAIAKAAEDAAAAPTDQYFLTLDADGVSVSSDFYLRLTGDIGKLFKNQIAPVKEHPTSHR